MLLGCLLSFNTPHCTVYMYSVHITVPIKWIKCRQWSHFYYFTISTNCWTERQWVRQFVQIVRTSEVMACAFSRTIYHVIAGHNGATRVQSRLRAGQHCTMTEENKKKKIEVHLWYRRQNVLKPDVKWLATSAHWRPQTHNKIRQIEINLMSLLLLYSAYIFCP